MTREHAADTPRLRWHRTTLDGRLAHYGDVGEGPPLVFLHGWGLSSTTYARALPGIAAAGVRVIAPALPGFGRSDELPGELTWESLAGWLDELLDHAGVDEPATLVGHSFGGGVATMTAWMYPERARALVLVNSIGGSQWRTDGGDAGGARSLAERPWWDWGIRAPREWTRRGYRKALPRVARDFLGNVVRHPGNLLRSGVLARTADLRHQLAQLADRGLPVTIVWSGQDRMLPEPAFVALCDASGATGDVVRGGHSWMLADPAGFGEIVTNSLTVRERVAARSEEAS